jgi:uncharacterized phage protein (TIGR02220 family)
MAKRFTDTNKYKKPFIRNLPGAYKLFWDYLYHDCSFAGIWHVDLDVAQIMVGKDMPIDKEKALSLFNAEEERIVVLNGGKKWLIRPFLAFQYGELVDTNKLHVGVMRELKKEGVSIPLIYPLQGVKDKDKDKVLEKEKEKEIIDDLNLVLGTSYKHNSSKTRELIHARLGEGFTLEDFKTVHRKMLRAWGADDKMVKYLRPITLYGPKFESYLNQKSITTKLTPEGIKAYLVGQEWLKSKEVVDVG